MTKPRITLQGGDELNNSFERGKSYTINKERNGRFVKFVGCRCYWRRRMKSGTWLLHFHFAHSISGKVRRAK